MPENINGIPLLWDEAADRSLLRRVLNDSTSGQQMRSLLGSNADNSPLLQQNWSNYDIDTFTQKFFEASKTLQRGNRLTLYFGGPDPQPTNPSNPFSIRDIVLDQDHFLRKGELFTYRNKDDKYNYTEKVDELLGKNLDLYLFFSVDGAWLLEMASKVNQIGDNELAIFLETSPMGSVDLFSNTVLIAKGGKNAAAYYNQPSLAEWYGMHCTITPNQVAELVQSCHDADALQIFLRNILSDIGSMIAWLPKKAGDLLCWLGEKIEGIAIEKSTWNKDWAAYWVQLFEDMEKSIARKTNEWVNEGIPLFGIHIPLPESFKVNVMEIGKILMGSCRAVIDFLKEIGPILNYLFSLLCGVINGIIDMVACFFIFVGWILKLIGGAVEEGVDAVGKADYYKGLLMEYADNFMQAIQKVNWSEVLKSITDWVKRIYRQIDLTAIGANISISGREVAYYIGYVGINIVGCFVGLGEIAAITRIGKAEGILKNLIEWVANALGKLPVAAKLSAEGIFAVLKAYVGLLVKGTKSVIEFINKVFEAILKWVLVVSGKIVREVFLLSLSSGKKLACNLLPLEDLAILLSKAISFPLRKKMNTFGIKFFEREGVYYATHNGEVIFEGNKEAVSKFIDEIESKTDDDIKKMLDELASSRKKRRVRPPTQTDVKIIELIRKKYGAGKRKNAAFAKGEVGGEQIDLESISGGELAQWSQKGNFNPPNPKQYFYNKGPEPYKEWHTEQKIIEFLRMKFIKNPNVNGRIEIVSDLKICDNCNWIMDAFQNEFPNIEIIRVFVRKKL